MQVGGEMLRISAAAFGKVRAERSALSQLLMRYALVLIQRGVQNGACIQHHTIEERMCRWLLETALRKGSDRFGLTQEFLADMLGVRRQSVNRTARLLQNAGLIDYHRGDLTILDRAGLEDASTVSLSNLPAGAPKTRPAHAGFGGRAARRSHVASAPLLTRRAPQVERLKWRRG